jgi:hypothetical protein
MVPNAREIMTQVQIEQQETAAANALEKNAAAGGQSVAEVWEMLVEDCNDDESCASDATADLVTLSDLILLLYSSPHRVSALYHHLRSISSIKKGSNILSQVLFSQFINFICIDARESFRKCNGIATHARSNVDADHLI